MARQLNWSSISQHPKVHTETKAED